MLTYCKSIFWLFLLTPVFLAAQFTDDFSDGDFTNNPAWSGDTADFVIENIFGNNKLRSNSTIASSNFYLSTPSSLVNNCQWEFWVNLAFNTSGPNVVDVYLTSDSFNLKAPNNNGYYVKIGNTQDEISLYKKVGGVSTKIIDGVDGVTNSSNNILKIRVIRDSTNLWNLEHDITGTGTNFVSEGTVSDADVTTSGFFGIHIFQSTASFFQKHYFDDFYVGPIVGDTSAPMLTSVTATSSNMLDVIFNETLEKMSAESILNYSVDNGIGNPSNAVRDAADSAIVHLTFTSSFQNCVQYTLTVSNVEDLSGNPIISATGDFVNCVPDVADYRDVIINEIFPIPDGSTALPNAEFVELYNRSSKVFDLSGWTFSDATGSTTLGAFILRANEYVILCSNSNIDSFSVFGDVRGVSSLPTLNNSGDNLSLKDNNGLLLDNVNYSDDWYRDETKEDGGWTLERIDPDFPCLDDGNWAASNHPSGGTPGRQNSIFGVYVDLVPPQVVLMEVVSINSIRLIFDEQLDSLSAVTLTNYLVDGNVGNPDFVNISSPDFLEVTLNFSTAFDSTTVYRLEIAGIKDCIGNEMQAVSEQFGIPGKASRYDVIINEIFADPDPSIGLPEAEFVELYNRSDKVISLQDWTLDGRSLGYALLFPGDYIILCPNSAVNEYRPYGMTLGMSSWSVLTNSGMVLPLRSSSGEVISYVEYSDSWYTSSIKKEGGFSLELIDPDDPCTGASNWRDSESALGGSPGKVNSVFGTNPDEKAPGLQQILLSDDNMVIMLIFDEPIDESSAFQPSSYTFDPPVGAIADIEVQEPAFDEIWLTLDNALQEGVIYTIVMEVIADCSGNIIGIDNTGRFGIPQDPDGKDLVINEILFNPTTGNSDFVELYNRSDKVINLRNLLIARADPFMEDDITHFTNITERGYLLLPQSYVVLTPDPDGIKAQFYTPNPKGFIEVSSMPNYPDDEGVVLVMDTMIKDSIIEYFPLDKVTYHEDWHFDLIDDLNGVSLERINYERPSQDENNWHSAATTVGYATPAYQNSQFGANIAASSSITLDPEIFSPDNDGYNDFLNIYYQFDQPGYAAKILIYDDEGREVRKLVENKLLDIKGSLIWDGVNNDGGKARIGYHIVFIEIFDLSGNVTRFRKTCVLAGRL